MLLEKFESAKWSQPFAKKREDINHGDVVMIAGDAERQPDQFNPGKFQTAIPISTKNGLKMASLSQTSINILIGEFGTNDASEWKGKPVKVLLHPTVIGGKKVLVLYLVGMTWELDEYGSPVNTKMIGAQTAPDEDIPVVNVDDDMKESGGVDLSKVPF